MVGIAQRPFQQQRQAVGVTDPENRATPNSFDRATFDFTTDPSSSRCIYSIEHMACPDGPHRIKVTGLYLMEQ